MNETTAVFIGIIIGVIENQIIQNLIKVSMQNALTQLYADSSFTSTMRRRFEMYYFDNQFISWADEFDKASLERKRMIADELLRQVSVSRGYEIQILMNASYQQFLAS